MTGTDLRNLLKAVNATAESFAKKAGLPVPRVKRLINKDRHKDITDDKVLEGVYTGGLSLVGDRVEKIKMQMQNIESFKPMFEELEQNLRLREKSQRLADKFEERFPDDE